MQGAGCSEAGFALQAAQRGSLPRAAQAGGARRPPEGRLQPGQVSHTTIPQSVRQSDQQRLYGSISQTTVMIHFFFVFFF